MGMCLSPLTTSPYRSPVRKPSAADLARRPSVTWRGDTRVSPGPAVVAAPHAGLPPRPATAGPSSAAQSAPSSTRSPPIHSPPAHSPLARSLAAVSPPAARSPVSPRGFSLPHQHSFGPVNIEQVDRLAAVQLAVSANADRQR